ncbi:phosphate ABC transporter substrate-binding protein [Cellulosilyticum lentocellum]|uniref:Phosphate-binding protein n=1 Tax=Cellulosilyticum lentocellum (strain ATCC 49066 / DSM 5427 / NCIMB 11756 / RHM5) TaxID=642492 RepID=F2JSN2_CELLD|nr:phosphate ABC transporter substrate-binding protein [Cellulosilyticum lentocellum]ADZ82866.1 phosphate binding protein [Cellulosilyticum lentocellum DSM 5427]
MKKKLLLCIAGVMIGTMALTGCGSSSSKGPKVSIVGSTTVSEPMEQLAEKYKETVPDANIEVQGNGSSAGIKAVADGTADMGMSSRELSEEEKRLGLTETVIAHDAIAVVVNTTNEVTNLTKEQIKDIYEGKITNWSQVGGKDENIIVVTREAGSGTRGAFEELLGLLTTDKASTIIDRALVSEGTGSIMATVASKENAIGYISLGYRNETVKLVEVDGVMPSAETVLANEYMISRPLLLLTSNNTSDEAKALLDYIVGAEGQSVIAEKYIPINQ